MTSTKEKEKSASGQAFRVSEGDWICEDQSCQNVNFARRVSCNLCGKERPNDGKGCKDKDIDGDNKRKIGHEIGKVAAEKSKGLFSADDWQCGRCGNVNWARRSTCNMCSAPKFSDNEERTGLGGGYNEREENVEYIEREDSDDDYDDFGRKKKKRLKSNDTNDTKINIQSNSHSKSDDNSEEEGEDEEDGDVSKYKLESDEEEDGEDEDVSKYKLQSDDDEEEEDSGDEDLSKYDLSDCVVDHKK